MKVKFDKNLFFDIDPQKKYIQKKDYLEFNIDKNNDIKYHVMGNPPFGRQSSLAKKFIKKSCSFCDSISFILPRSFKKESYQKVFPLNFHLIFQEDIELNAFQVNKKEYNVPCVFLI